MKFVHAAYSAPRPLFPSPAPTSLDQSAGVEEGEEGECDCQ